MIEKLQTVIKFVSENSGGGDVPFNPGGGYPIAPTSDVTALIFALIALIGFVAGIFIFVKNFTPAYSLKNACHATFSANGESKFKVALAICLSIFAVFLAISITKIASASEDQSNFYVSPQVFAYVNDQGEVRFDTAQLNYSGPTKLHINNVNLQYCDDIALDDVE